jgi:UDP-3-O-[3-hydroxymyristoyl] glucosamine N-acyltransferase
MMPEAFIDCELMPGGWWMHRLAAVDSSAVIFPGVYIGPNVTINKHCIIGPNTCIGQPGFGYNTLEDGTREYRQHVEGVYLAKDVHVGANTCIDQGRHRTTEIGAGTKIDNLVHIAHNVIIGKRCLIIAHTMLGGSVTIGDDAHIAPGSLIRDWRNVGANATSGLGAVVVKDIPTGETHAGNPAHNLEVRNDRQCAGPS